MRIAPLLTTVIVLAFAVTTGCNVPVGEADKGDAGRRGPDDDGVTTDDGVTDEDGATTDVGVSDDDGVTFDDGVPDDGVPDDGVPDDGVPDDGVPDGAPPDSGSPDGGGPAEPGTWTVRHHGVDSLYMTSTLMCLSDDDCFVGNGYEGTGRGFSWTRDGGRTWSNPMTRPARFLETSRVHEVWYSHDTELVYVSGQHGNDRSVVSLARGGALADVYVRILRGDRAAIAGQYRRAADGRQVLMGHLGQEILYASEDNLDAEAWDTLDDPGVIQGLEEHEGTFYVLHAGGVHNRPTPTVGISDWDEDGLRFESVSLIDPDGLAWFPAHLRTIDINDDGIVVGGGADRRNNGVIFSFDLRAEADVTDRDNWTYTDVSSFDRLGGTSAVHGVCRGADNIVYAVGAELRGVWGFVLRSDDGGRTFVDVSPYTDPQRPDRSVLEALHKCHVTSDGGVYVVGAEATFAIYNP